MPGPADRPVTLAAVVGAHGIAGEVRLKLFCDGVDGLRCHGAFMVAGRSLTLKSVKADRLGAIARFAEVADRTAAEALRGSLLAVPRASLPPLPPGEYYWHDLVGLPVVSPDGVALGLVVAVENYGASDLIEVELPAGARVLVPLIADAATVEEARVVVADGWLV